MSSLKLQGANASYIWSTRWRLPEPGNGSFIFDCLARNDVHICLADRALTLSPTADPVDCYEIVIGGWNNTQSVIRTRRQRNEVAKALKGVDGKGVNTFWVKVDHGQIRVGTGDVVGEQEFMQATATEKAGTLAVSWVVRRERERK